MSRFWERVEDQALDGNTAQDLTFQNPTGEKEFSYRRPGRSQNLSHWAHFQNDVHQDFSVSIKELMLSL